jgi:hypothetical protein
MAENIAKSLLIEVKRNLVLMPEFKRKSPDITQIRFWWGRGCRTRCSSTGLSFRDPESPKKMSRQVEIRGGGKKVQVTARKS